MAGTAALRVRIVYVGTSAFAGAVLRRLHDSPHSPVLVVSRPDSPQGRGRKLTSPPTVEVARELGLDVYQPGSVNSEESLARIDVARPDALCVCAFGSLIKEPLLSRYQILNVHPSLLPRWRGAAPIERAILAGDPETGVSIMRLTAGLDSGPVCLEGRVAIEADDDYGTLSASLEALGGDLLVRALDEQPPCAEQDESGVTYAEKLTAADRRLDPSEPAAARARRVRALSPHIGAYVVQPDGTRLGVWKARAVGDTLELLIVQPPGKRQMPWADYQRGLKQ
ncbi:MAG TPA: methionyl-tRNA formyltransferase [Solirubrobacteraceae bacterium]|nr:methionyl-tRNA formyltransferase [Solirubrobacteraceae bacterium]